MEELSADQPRAGAGDGGGGLYISKDLVDEFCAGIFERSMGARNRIGKGFSYRPARLPQPGGIGSLESILGLFEGLKIRALF